jgi:hypothetical protein
MATTDGTASQRPTLRVIRGDASLEEVAALVAALAAVRAAAAPARAPEPRSAWAERRAGLRRPVAIGPGSWRRAAWSGDNVRTRADW